MDSAAARGSCGATASSGSPSSWALSWYSACGRKEPTLGCGRGREREQAGAGGSKARLAALGTCRAEHMPPAAAPPAATPHLSHAVGDGHLQRGLAPALLRRCCQKVGHLDRLPHQHAQLLACRQERRVDR